MQTFTAFTNLYTETDTIRDIQQRGRAVRLHPDPVTAADRSRPDDTIVEVTFNIPDGATFVLYTWEHERFIVFATSPDFPAAYALAQKAGENARLSTAVSVDKSSGTAIIPVAKYATSLAPVDGAIELAAA